MAWLSDPNDKDVLQKIHECMGLYYSKLGGQVQETLTGFSVCFQDITESIDFKIMSQLVELARPHVHDLSVYWNDEKSLSLVIELYSTKHLKQATYPTYSPAVSIPMELQESLAENGFDIRQAPANWDALYHHIENLCKIIYSRGSDISVPQISLIAERNQPTWVEIGNMDSVHYSFLEHLAMLVNVKEIVAEPNNNALWFEMSDSETLLLCHRQST